MVKQILYIRDEFEGYKKYMSKDMDELEADEIISRLHQFCDQTNDDAYFVFADSSIYLAKVSHAYQGGRLTVVYYVLVLEDETQVPNITLDVFQKYKINRFGVLNDVLCTSYVDMNQIMDKYHLNQSQFAQFLAQVYEYLFSNHHRSFGIYAPKEEMFISICMILLHLLPKSLRNQVIFSNKEMEGINIHISDHQSILHHCDIGYDIDSKQSYYKSFSDLEPYISCLLSYPQSQRDLYLDEIKDEITFKNKLILQNVDLISNETYENKMAYLKNCISSNTLSLNLLKTILDTEEVSQNIILEWYTLCHGEVEEYLENYIINHSIRLDFESLKRLLKTDSIKLKKYIEETYLQEDDELAQNIYAVLENEFPHFYVDSYKYSSYDRYFASKLNEFNVLNLDHVLYYVQESQHHYYKDITYKTLLDLLIQAYDHLMKHCYEDGNKYYHIQKIARQIIDAQHVDFVSKYKNYIFNHVILSFWKHATYFSFDYTSRTIYKKLNVSHRFDYHNCYQLNEKIDEFYINKDWTILLDYLINDQYITEHSTRKRILDEILFDLDENVVALKCINQKDLSFDYATFLKSVDISSKDDIVILNYLKDNYTGYKRWKMNCFILYLNKSIFSK